MKTINEIYKNAVIDVYNNGFTTKPRGMLVKELLAYSLVIDPKDNIIALPGFETNVAYAKEELEWYLSGTNRIDWSPKIQKIWAKYSDDGITVNSNYGHRIFGNYERMPINQWEWVKNKLIEDPDSRQAVININNAFDKERNSKDVPCTVYLQAFIRDNALHFIGNMRSNDIFFGFRNDVYCFTELQKKMAQELGIKVGNYYHFAGSLHMYEKDFQKAEKLIGLEKIIGDKL
jgi:thymidylate synthase